MHIPQRDIATAEAAKLALSSLQKVLPDTTSPEKLIRNALIPVFGIRRDALAFRRVTMDRLGRVLCSLRNSKLDSETYRGISPPRTTASETETESPQAWADWRAAIERFNLDDEFKLTEWIEAIDTFKKLGWGSPSKMALVSATQLRKVTSRVTPHSNFGQQQPFYSRTFPQLHSLFSRGRPKTRRSSPAASNRRQFARMRPDPTSRRR